MRKRAKEALFEVLRLCVEETWVFLLSLGS